MSWRQNPYLGQSRDPTLGINVAIDEHGVYLESKMFQSINMQTVASMAKLEIFNVKIVNDLGASRFSFDDWCEAWDREAN